MDPAELLKERRKAHGLNQKQLAALAKTSQGQISRIERGAISPSFETLRKILAAIGEELDVRSAPPRTETTIVSSRGNRKITTDPASLLYG